MILKSEILQNYTKIKQKDKMMKEKKQFVIKGNLQGIN